MSPAPHRLCAGPSVVTRDAPRRDPCCLRHRPLLSRQARFTDPSFLLLLPLSDCSRGSIFSSPPSKNSRELFGSRRGPAPPRRGPCSREATKGGPGSSGGQRVQRQPQAEEARGALPAPGAPCRHHDHLLQPLPQAAAGAGELLAQQGRGSARCLQTLQVSCSSPTGLQGMKMRMGMASPPSPWAGFPKELALQVDQERLEGSPGPDQRGAAGAALPAAHLGAGEGAPLLPAHHGPGVPPAAGRSPLPSRYPWAPLHLPGTLHGALLPQEPHAVLPLQFRLPRRARCSLRSSSPCCRASCWCSRPLASWSTSPRTSPRSWASPW